MQATRPIMSRKAVLTGMAATMGAGFMGTATAGRASAATAAADASNPISVKTMGATGDGVTDDTAAVVDALVAAAGGETYFPPGTYVLDGLPVDKTARIRLDPGATLQHKAGSGSGSMIVFNGTDLRITGGTVDGNKGNQSGRPYIISGTVESGRSIQLEDVSFVNSVASIVYAQNFGGLLSMERCRVTGQAEHDGVLGHTTSILRTISGQQGESGLVRFNHNFCIGTDSPAIAGGNPGGIFIATNGYLAGSPGSEGFANGNMSTLEAIGNYFWGYGQNAAGNDISPIHTYPAVEGARIVGNYFERCGFCAISAKSVVNFVCTGNVIVNGLTSSQNVASEGAISYMPGYQAASQSRPRAVISGNIVDTPGGQPDERQAGISVHGLTNSHAQQVIITDNVLSGCGRGIKVNYVDDITISGNVINGSTGDSTYTKDEDGIRLDNVYGTVLINGNRISTPHGFGLYALAGVSTARFTVVDNVFEHSSSSHYGTTIRGVDYLRLGGNTYRATAGTALYLTAYGSTKIGYLDLGDNAFVQGPVVLDFTGIAKITGRVQGSVDPRGRVTPGEVGTTYRKTNGKEPDTLWISTGLKATDWAPLLTAGVDGYTPTFKLGTGAGANTGASASVTGNDTEGVIELTTGTTPTVEALIGTMVFASVRSLPAKAVVLTPANAAAAAQMPNVYVAKSSLALSTFGVSNTGTGLKGSTTFQWYYRVL